MGAGGASLTPVRSLLFPRLQQSPGPSSTMWLLVFSFLLMSAGEGGPDQVGTRLWEWGAPSLPDPEQYPGPAICQPLPYPETN